MSPILFFIIFFICTGVGKIFLQINSAAVAFIDILIAAWEGLGYKAKSLDCEKLANCDLHFFWSKSHYYDSLSHSLVVTHQILFKI